MNNVSPQQPLHMSGIVYIDIWNKKRDGSSLSLISDRGKEYRVYSNHVAKSLSKHVWDDVVVEFSFVDVDTLSNELWIEVSNFSLNDRSHNLSHSLAHDGIYYSYEEERNERYFDVNSFLDKFEKYELA